MVIVRFFLSSSYFLFFYFQTHSAFCPQTLQSVKVKFVTVRDMKDKWRNGGISPFILNLCSKWQWVVSFTARSLYCRGNNYPEPSDWGPRPVWTLCGKEQKNLLPIPVIGPRLFGPPAHSPVTVPTMMSLYTQCYFFCGASGRFRAMASPISFLQPFL